MKFRVIRSFFDPETGELDIPDLDEHERESSELENFNETQAQNEVNYIGDGNSGSLATVSRAIEMLHRSYRDLLDAIDDAQDSTHRNQINTRRTHIESRINYVDGRIQHYEGRIAAVNAQIAEVENQIASLNSEIEALDTQITDINADIDDVLEDMEELFRELLNYTGTITNIEDMLDNILYRTALGNSIELFDDMREDLESLRNTRGQRQATRQNRITERNQRQSEIAPLQAQRAEYQAQLDHYRNLRIQYELQWTSEVGTYNNRVRLVYERAQTVETRRTEALSAIQTEINNLQAGAVSGRYSQDFVDNMVDSLESKRSGIIHNNTTHHIIIPPHGGSNSAIRDAGRSFYNSNRICNCVPGSVCPIECFRTPVPAIRPFSEFSGGICQQIRNFFANSPSNGEELPPDNQEEQDRNNEKSDKLDNPDSFADGSDHRRPRIGDLPNLPQAYLRGSPSGSSLGGGAGARIAGSLLLPEYGVQMFTNFTTNRVLRDDKRLEGTEHETMLTGVPLHELNGLSFWYGAELEYLLWGNPRALTNFTYTIGVLGTMFATGNFLFTFRCEALNAEIKLLKLIPVFGVALSWVYRAAIVAAETYFDIQSLLDGKRVPLLKNPVNLENLGTAEPDPMEFRTSLIYAGFAVIAGTLWHEPGSPFEEREVRSGRGLYYYQYLRMMLILRTLINPNVVAQRIATLIEVNMNYHISLRNGNNFLPETPTHFKLSRSFITTDVTIAGKLPYFFIGRLPLITEEDADARKRRPFSVTVQRGY